MTERTDRVIRIGGDAGEGILSCGQMLSQALARAGYEIFTLQVIPAEIKGGLCNFLVRADTQPLHSHGEGLDVLVCFNEEAYSVLYEDLKSGGLLIYDPQRFSPKGNGFIPYPIRLEYMAVQEVKSALSKNVVALGALASLVKLPPNVCEQMIHERWIKKGEAVVNRNLKAFKLGYEYVRDNPPPLDITMAPPRSASTERMVVDGNDMISMGALVSGCNYYAGYPITPASTILEFLEHQLPKFGGYALQTEDEIAAISSCVGASYAGAKAMTATSGPGFSLMTEILGLATMTEVPLVVIDVQRAGPSTGMPTKTEQSDLNLTVYGGHGDVPRIVVAPADVEDCFYTICDAFNLAEKYQMPVILLSDYSLATRTQTIAKPDFKAVQVENRIKPTDDDLKPYLRYKTTPNGVSPMAIPGMPGGQYTTTGLEHNETGAPHMTPKMHRVMTQKRFQKLIEAGKEQGYTLRFGSPQATVGVVCWGSTLGPVREAVDKATAQGYPVAALQVRMLYPIPPEVRTFMDSMHTVLVPELNYTGQFAQMLRARFLKPVVQMNKYQGLPFTAGEIFQKIVELCEIPVSSARPASN